MLLSYCPLAIVLSFQLAAFSNAAAEYTETIWGVFAYHTYGDSLPNVMSEVKDKALSDYGASQLEAAGSIFRNRYVETPGGNVNSTGLTIQGLHPFILDSRDVNILTTTDQYVIASAQAFMQGLYPPLNQSNFQDADSTPNGTFYSYPLGGYQYPKIVSLGSADPQSLMVAGQAQCPMHQAAVDEYRASSAAQDLTQENAAFYTNIWKDALSGDFDESQATYLNAIDIADFLDYEILHNTQALEKISDYDLRRARWLADQYTYATNGENDQHSVIGVMNPVAGQTLASSILSAFAMNMETSGMQQKVTLLFGSDEPAVAIASLLGLAKEQQPNFYSRLVRGGSLVFELYSLETQEAYSPSYPGPDNLFVRFYLHNGTDSSTFVPYPLFGYGPSRESVPYSEFKSEIETFAMQSVKEWCTRCNSESIFCTGLMGDGSPSKPKKQMSPVVAGVIGAFVTLGVCVFIGLLGLFLCGIRKRGSHKPSLGGFKGNDKNASDADLTFRKPIWGSTSKPTNVDTDDPSTAGIVVHGHERLGSWEMGQQRKEVEDITSPTHDGAPHLSPFDDENDEEWRIHSGLQPVKVRESV